jgi:hypothetical protein
MLTQDKSMSKQMLMASAQPLWNSNPHFSLCNNVAGWTSLATARGATLERLYMTERAMDSALFTTEAMVRLGLPKDDTERTLFINALTKTDKAFMLSGMTEVRVQIREHSVGQDEGDNKIIGEFCNSDGLWSSVTTV